jgi:hypothetical protein
MTHRAEDIPEDSRDSGEPIATEDSPPALEPASGLIEVALNISRQRRDILIKLLSAVEDNDLTSAKAFAKELHGR